MEFYNTKLLPKGLPELMVAFVPYHEYPFTKVIACPKKLYEHTFGMFTSDNLTYSYNIYLYPTVMASGNDFGTRIGTYSFKLWRRCLEVALHEIGHLITRHVVPLNGNGTFNNPDSYLYSEDLAEDFAHRSMAKILEADPRMGQPLGALTGYLGIKAHELRNSGVPWGNEYNNYCMSRINEWRGLKCGGQVPISDIVYELYRKWDYDRQLTPQIKNDEHVYRYAALMLRSIIRRKIHKVARKLGINRHAECNNKKYLMFNVREAETVYDELVDHPFPITIPKGIKNLMEDYMYEQEYEKECQYQKECQYEIEAEASGFSEFPF